jgi:hypothetical protein
MQAFLAKQLPTRLPRLLREPVIAADSFISILIYGGSTIGGEGSLLTFAYLSAPNAKMKISLSCAPGSFQSILKQ